jgi:hypothetical protein
LLEVRSDSRAMATAAEMKAAVSSALREEKVQDEGTVGGGECCVNLSQTLRPLAAMTEGNWVQLDV